MSPVGFRLLGPLEFFDGKRWSAIGAPKQRSLLAVLLINANRTVSADQLVAELWGEQPPASAAGLLAGYVWRLRRRLDDLDGRTLITRAPGYQLVLPRGSTDVHEYEDLVTAGRRDLAAGDLDAAVTNLSTALDMWRGSPLADVALVPSVLAESARLEEERLSVVEARIEGEIGLDRHGTLLPELKLIVSQYPLRERLHEHLMTALYRSGQQAEALGAYRDLRQLLVDELGVEPSKPLRELQGRILRDDPSLLEPARRSAANAVLRLAIPRTLPPDVPVFVSRDQELALITARLTEGEQRCAIHGMAGAGKTALAVHAAHLAAGSFPDGQVYLNMGACGTSDPVRPVKAIARLLTAMGLAAEDVPADEDRATALLRTALAGRRLVMVLDDVLDTRQIQHLLPATPGCAVIIAGRPAATVVAGSSLVRLGHLPVQGSVDLVRRYAGTARVDADLAAAARLARLCDHLPLALRVAATRLAQRPEWTVADLARRLADPQRRLDTLACDGLSVRESLRAGARLAARLTDPSISHAIGRLGILDLPVLPSAAFAAVLEIPEPQAELTAERLVDAGLVEPLSIDRYRVPGLVRLYARSEHVPADEERAATGNIVGYYVDAVRDQLAQLAIADEGRQRPGRIAGLAWYRRECVALRTLADRLPRTELGGLVTQLRSALHATAQTVQ
jgi:DNA-binding SARP family transcriptional activator